MGGILGFKLGKAAFGVGKFAFNVAKAPFVLGGKAVKTGKNVVKFKPPMVFNSGNAEFLIESLHSIFSKI